MKVQINKLELMEGEEVLELGDKVMSALAQQKGKLKKSLFLRGIYNDHVITKDRETGKLFRFEIKRNSSGGIELTNMSEVRPAGFVPVKQKSEKAEDPIESMVVVEGTEVKVPMDPDAIVTLLKGIDSSEPEEIDLVEKTESLWQDVVPSRR